MSSRFVTMYSFRLYLDVIVFEIFLRCMPIVAVSEPNSF